MSEELPPSEAAERKAVDEERATVQRRLDESVPGGEGGDRADSAPDPELQAMLRSIAAKRLDSLDSLPPDVGARVRAPCRRFLHAASPKHSDGRWHLQG